MGRQIIGSTIIHLDQVDSTNRYAMEQMGMRRFAEGCLIVASHQYAGRGMEHNQWESEPGKNLTFSVVLYPAFLPMDKQFMLNKMVSLALLDFVRPLSETEKVRIKWPNDLYIGDRKAAGVLIHNAIMGNSFIHTIIGIGININQEVFRSDAPNPVSLKNITGRAYDLDLCLSDLSDRLDLRYQALKYGSFHDLDEEYLQNLYRLGEPFPYRYKDRRIDARIESVDEFGHLVVVTSKNEKIVADQKEIVFIIQPVA